MEPVETVPAISGGHPSPRKNQRRLAMTPYLASRRDTREICEIPYLSGGEAGGFSSTACVAFCRQAPAASSPSPLVPLELSSHFDVYAISMSDEEAKIVV
jgi:hypothetical protein